jgi:type IV pilus assembly protein PilQ
VNRLNGLNPFLISSASALITLVAQPALASVTSITGVQLNQTDAGVDIVFETEGADASNIFTVNQGNTLRADITRTQLKLPDGNEFRQANPAPGIAEISVIPLDANSVRVTVSGTDGAPVGEVASAGSRVVMSISGNGAPVAQQPTPVPETIETVPGPAQPEVVAQVENEPVPDPDVIIEAEEEVVVPITEQQPEVLVPNPEVVIDGVPVPQPRAPQAPPFLPRAVAPPVGDIAVAESGIDAYVINLGSNERIPKLLLRDASAREVLALLARAAGLNLVFTAEGAEGGGGEGPTVTLDIENESVQDVFNHVLRVTGLQANRVGETIYVGPRLPLGARAVISRTLRLNQVGSSDAAGYLASLGATATQTITTNEIEIVTVEPAVEGGNPITRSIETESTTVEEITFDPAEDSGVAVPLAGLQAVADPRLNSITLVGEANLVELATEYLTRLDLRRRQVAVNVKVIDLDLSATDSFGVSFSYLNNGLSVGFGGPGGAGLGVGIDTNAANPFQQRLILNIDALISESNAKILTDPTLIVQEGQTASVALVEQVLSSIDTQIDGDSGVIVQTPVFQDAGLILSVQVERIDDNGFVTFNVSPTISSPQAPVPFQGTGGISNLLTPIARREVSSGSIRVRDGQTLILSGIIQDRELSTVTKIPILGDLPIIGALFRDTTTTDERNEVVVLLTPQILDDSDQTAWGYSYTPSEEAQEILNSQPQP